MAKKNALQNVVMGRVLASRRFNISRSLTVAEMLEQRDSAHDTAAKRDAIALSLAQAGLLPQEGPYYAAPLSDVVTKYAPGMTAEAVVEEALREQAAYWSGFTPTVVKTGVEDAKDAPTVAIDKTHILKEFLSLWFTDKNPAVVSSGIDGLYKEVAALIGQKFDAEKTYGSTVELVAACGNRRNMSAPYAQAISRQAGEFHGLKYETLGIIDASDFVVVNFRENHKAEVGAAALKVRGGEALNSFVAHYKNGATRADFGAATAAFPCRLNLIASSGKNDNSAIVRAYAFAKCECAFPELGLLKVFGTPDSSGKFKALPGNTVLEKLLGKLKELCNTAQVGFVYGKPGTFEFSTAVYGELSPEMEKFKTENAAAYAECTQEVKYAFGLEQRPNTVAPTNTDKADAAAKAAAPKAAEVAAAVATAPDFVRVLTEFISTGKNAKLAQWVLDTLRKNAPEFGALFDRLAGNPPAEAVVPAEVEPEAVEA